MHILLTGASGQLGGYLLRRLREHSYSVTAWSGTRTGNLFGFPFTPIDFAHVDQIATAFRAARPEVIIHAGAMSVVADCYREPERARRVNTVATQTIAELAEKARARMIFASTDLVFDGVKGSYSEDDAPTPLSIYGRGKADAEHAVLAVPRGVVTRVSLLYGTTLVGRPAFFDNQIRDLRAGKAFPLFEDEWRTPLDLDTAARALLTLAEHDYEGLLHIGGPERMSRLEMGVRLAKAIGADPAIIVVSRRDDVKSPEPRPRDASLDSSRWRRLFPRQEYPNWIEALAKVLPKQHA